MLISIATADAHVQVMQHLDAPEEAQQTLAQCV